MGGDDQREPGAHAGHRHARSRGRRWRPSAPSGRCGPPSSARSPSPSPTGAAACASATAWTARCWPTSRPRHCPTTHRSTTAPARRRLPPRRPHPRRRPTAAPTCWRCCARRAGSTASTTTSSSSTPWSVRAPTLRCSGWPARGCRPRSAAWRSRRTRTPGPARSTRGPARRWCWPRAWPTWPASARRRSRSSTA